MTILLSKKTDFSYILTPQEEIYKKGTNKTFDEEIKEEVSDLVRKAKIFYQAGELNLESKDYSVAVRNFKNSVDIIPTMSAYLNLGIAYINTSDFQHAEEVLNYGLYLAEKRQNYKYEATFYGNIGLVNVRKKEYDRALELLEKAKNIHEKIGDKNGEASDYGNMGVVYRRKRDTLQGLKVLALALEKYEKLGDKKGMAIQLGNIGNIYYDSAFSKDDPDNLESPEKLKEALRYYEKALNLFIETKYKVGIAIVYRNLGKTYDWLGRYKDALDNYQESYEIYEQEKNYSQLAILLNDKGIVLRLLSRYEEGLKAFDMAIELKPDFSDAWYNRACIYSIKGHKEDALKNLTKAIELDSTLKKLAKNDEDLEKLWGDQEFIKLVKK
jgi:tetratricopeptide (TPR) repeat protein